MGAPSTHTPERAKKVCDHIISGKSLREIGRIEGMPSPSTVMAWLSKSEEFQSQYAHAREIQQEKYLEEIMEIADASDGEYQRDRLRIDARKWTMSKLAPKKYGDKLQSDVTVTDDRTKEQRDNAVRSVIATND